MPRKVFPFAINTYSYIMKLGAEACITHLADQGYTDFEIMMYPGHFWPAELDSAKRRHLRSLLEQRGLRIVVANMPNIDLNIAGVMKEMRDYSIKLMENLIDLGADLGAPGILLGPGKANTFFPAPREELMSYLFEALDVLVPRARDRGAEIWLENIPFCFIPSAADLKSALEEYGDDRIGVVYDVANATFIGEKLDDGLRLLKDRVKMVHLSDTGRDRLLHAPVGEGIVAFETIPPVLKEIGYDKVTVLEIVSPDPDAAIRASIEKLKMRGWAAQAA